MEGWQELINQVKRVIEYGLHCNDMTYGEIEDDICFALEEYAKKNGLPEPEWDE